MKFFNADVFAICSQSWRDSVQTVCVARLCGSMRVSIRTFCVVAIIKKNSNCGVPQALHSKLHRRAACNLQSISEGARRSCSHSRREILARSDAKAVKQASTSRRAIQRTRNGEGRKSNGSHLDPQRATLSQEAAPCEIDS